VSETGETATGRRANKRAAVFRTIGEVAEDLDLPAHVLRFWESKFSQLKPLKRGGGRRYYRPEDIALLSRIRQCLYQEGYTIRGVQKLLSEGALDASNAAIDVAPSLFPLDPLAVPEPRPRSARAASRATAPEPAREPEPIVIAEPQPVGLSPDGKAALQAAAQELLSARQLLEALLQRRRKD
jgi:DNA-binding transcriptional MerR regulator